MPSELEGRWQHNDVTAHFHSDGRFEFQSATLGNASGTFAVFHDMTLESTSRSLAQILTGSPTGYYLQLQYEGLDTGQPHRELYIVEDLTADRLNIRLLPTSRLIELERVHEP